MYLSICFFIVLSWPFVGAGQGKMKLLLLRYIPPDFVVSGESRKIMWDGSPDFPILCRDQSSTAGEDREPSMGTKHICLPFPSEAQYRACVDDPAQYRQYLTQMLRQYPELFPKAMD